MLYSTTDTDIYMFNKKVSPQTPEGREGVWKYSYTHCYHRHLTEVRVQPHAQPIYLRLKLKSTSDTEYDARWAGLEVFGEEGNFLSSAGPEHQVVRSVECVKVMV